MAAFEDISELGKDVLDPEGFRQNLNNMVLFMNDQMPRWVKVKPCKQVFADFETASGSPAKQITLNPDDRQDTQTMVLGEGDESDADDN